MLANAEESVKLYDIDKRTRVLEKFKLTIDLDTNPSNNVKLRGRVRLVGD